QGINRRRPHLQTSVAATFTRDDVAVRRSILAPHGLVAHQSFLPRDTAIETIRGLLVRAQVAEHVPSLALLKKHRASDFLLTPLPAGYSLTLEIPLRPGGEARAQALLRDLNTIVIEAGGCCSLATDSAANAEQARRMIGEQRLARFREVKAQSDPDGLLCTDLYRRVIAPGGASSGQSAAKRSKAATTSRAMPATASGMRKVRKR
nr:FAD-binding oxidoreductase [Ktedonobacterales bacterium]